MIKFLAILSAFSMTYCGTKKKEKTVYVIGEKGDPGEPGEPGDNGMNGKDGMGGKDGMNGRDGMNGGKGDQGEQGVAGPQGPAGRDGTNGRDGVDGHNGNDGRDGHDGAAGQDGEDGEDGDDGEYVIVPQPKYSKYCYGYRDVYSTLLDECGNPITTTAKYHIFYQVYTMPNGDVFSRMCEGYNATLNNCSNGLLTTGTWTIGDQNYSTAPLLSRYVSAKLTAANKAELKGKDWVLNVSCTNLP